MMRYTAGELARVLGVSARTVRFYDEKGILAPVGHSESGYRIYDETSVEKLQKILMLRFLDFSLEQIRGIMGEGDGQEEGEDSLWENLRHIVEITREKDAENFSYPEKDFHRVVANHMLYHLKREKRPALYQAIRSLLNPKGIFSCSLIGREHNRELHDLLREYYPMIEILSEGFDIFLETAEEELQEYFPQAEAWEQENDLLVPDVELIYNYVASYSPEAAGILKKDRARFLERVQAQMNADGFMYIHKSTGVVICRQE